jgi:hypothetical protein
VGIGRGVRHGCCVLQILFNLYSEYLTKEDLEGFADFRIGGKGIRTVKYAEHILLLAKEERLIGCEIGRCYGIEMTVKRSNVIRSHGNHPQ